VLGHASSSHMQAHRGHRIRQRRTPHWSTRIPTKHWARQKTHSFTAWKELPRDHVEDDNAWRNTNNSFIVSVFNVNFFLTGMDSYLLLLAWTICVHEGGAHAEREVRLKFLFLCGKSRAWLMQTLKENLFLTNPS